ncbi:two-component sensor histidine kinase [Neobacillus piezotolerans]|uniref:histidine kinase n=1 Tax=Neobacillus piezotolerans TaxID=2259171 RepID=A0A3D8GR71_9BACI|nr:ATP-binding protein [Neobacillus piezotolerans]RDU36771.1 two-component sensor histidine kinase [Neobacillus piezotolerans]
MNENLKDVRLVSEEVKALKLFFYLFYPTFIVVDLFLFLAYRGTKSSAHYVLDPFEVAWYYLIVLGLLPLSIYWIKRYSPFSVKYLFFICFSIVDFNYIVYAYMNSPGNILSSNFVELIFILLVPTFVNKRYFWVICIGTIIKYLFCGLVLQTTEVFVPMALYMLISSISFIILNRYSSHLMAITEVYEELRQKEKLISVGQMATGIAHEIRNPLTALKGFIQLQQETSNSKDYSLIMNQEIDRLTTIVDDLMILGKPKSASFTKIDLKEMIDYGLSIAMQFARGTRITFIKEFDANPALIKGDEKQLKQVIINLVKNSIESMAEEGTIKISLRSFDENQIVLSIADEGYGIPEEHIKKLCDPFFTTKKDGTGLGLMVTNQIVMDHGGKIEIQSEINTGTKIDILLPKLQ